jgi:cytochrome P450
MFSADPDRFNPDRWMPHASPDLINMSSGFNYVPFGVGARSCVGKHYATLLSRTFCIELAHACRRWHLTTPLPVPMLKVPVIRPKDKLCAVFEPRVK